MSKQAGSATERIVLERTYPGTLEEVWELWTTPAGIESWWGPDGFRVTVRSMDLRPGGELHYVMEAVAPETVEFMKRNGMPTAQEARVRYTAVEPPHRLVYLHAADFIPGVRPYDVETALALHATPTGVRLVLELERMHDETWTQRAVAGWEMELGKLARLLAARRGEARAP
jgi:uncharacterized protein YndB with AHSA1/START domain